MLDATGLMPHQIVGAQWLIDNPTGMLAWQMRCGKTATALRAWECTPQHGPLLVLCPATGRENWAREAKRFSLDPDLPPNVQVLTNSTTPISSAADIVITNYDKLLNPNVAKRLRGRGRWGAIIADEAKALRNVGAQRTQLVYGGGKQKNQRPLVELTDRFWPLEGTPMLNHPAELYPHARALWPQAIEYRGRPMELWEFELQYCQIVQGDYGPKIVGGKNLGELKERLSPHMNRLKLRDVIQDLPPVRVDSWPLDMETTSGVGRYPDAPELMEQLTRQYGAPSDIERFDNDTLAAYLAAIEGQQVHLAALRREVGTLKAIACSFLVRDELEANDEKVVVFAYGREAIATLTKGLAQFQPAVIHGGVEAGKRMAEVDRFTNDPACRVFIGQLEAAGQIIDLSVASNVIFCEAAWSPPINEQALFRVLGVKQKKPVFVRFTYLRGVIDEALNRANARKNAMISQVIN